MNNNTVTDKDVVEALKVFNKVPLAVEDPERINALLHRKLTLEEVLRVVSVIVYPTNKYSMENIKNISMANMMINKLVKILLSDKTDEEVDKYTEKLWSDVEKEYDETNKEKDKALKEALAKQAEQAQKEGK